MHTSLTVIHVIFCVLLILTILLQTGGGADMGAIFGGSSQTAFGSRGAGTFLSRMTTGVAILFMVTSMVLAIMGRSIHSVMDSVSKSPAIPVQQPPIVPPITAPAIPIPSAAQPAAPEAKTGPETAREVVSPKAVSSRVPAPVPAASVSEEAVVPAPLEEKESEPESAPSN